MCVNSTQATILIRAFCNTSSDFHMVEKTVIWWKWCNSLCYICHHSVLICFDTLICCFFHLSICPSICRASYFRNFTSSDYNFWYACVKWWYLQAFFSICFQFFFKFWFFGCLGGKRAKNSPKWKMKIAFVMHHISGTV